MHQRRESEGPAQSMETAQWVPALMEAKAKAKVKEKHREHQKGHAAVGQKQNPEGRRAPGWHLLPEESVDGRWRQKRP